MQKKGQWTASRVRGLCIMHITVHGLRSMWKGVDACVGALTCSLLPRIYGIVLSRLVWGIPYRIGTNCPIWDVLVVLCLEVSLSLFNINFGMDGNQFQTDLSGVELPYPKNQFKLRGTDQLHLVWICSAGSWQVSDWSNFRILLHYNFLKGPKCAFWHHKLMNIQTRIKLFEIKPVI